MNESTCQNRETGQTKIDHILIYTIFKLTEFQQQQEIKQRFLNKKLYD